MWYIKCNVIWRHRSFSAFINDRQSNIISTCARDMPELSEAQKSCRLQKLVAGSLSELLTAHHFPQQYITVRNIYSPRPLLSQSIHSHIKGPRVNHAQLSREVKRSRLLRGTARAREQGTTGEHGAEGGAAGGDISQGAWPSGHD